MNVNTLIKILNILEKEVKNYKVPIITLMSQRKQDPYQILIGTILSLRTKDKVTAQASQRLFSKAATPKEMLTLTEDQIEKLIYPVGFYKNKSKSIKQISNFILVAFGQNTCVPISPFCSRCPVNNYCEKKMVSKSR